MRKVFKRALALMLSAAMIVTGFGGNTGATVVKAETVTMYDYTDADGNKVGKEGYQTVFENFITVEGTKLMDGDKELKFVSLNYPQATSDTAWESENAVKTIKAMGGNVTRSYTIPVYNGQNADTAYVTGVDANGNLTFNEDALNSLDNLLAACNKHGVRLIIPFVDHWHWIGGMDGYVWLAGEADGTPSQSGFQSWAWKFYSSEKCMDYFKQMITHLLNRVNSVTGVKYMYDPAILCWETGNEVGNRQQDEYDEMMSKWTNEVANHVRSIYGDTTIPYEAVSTVLTGKKLAFLGSSVTYGHLTDGVSFVDYLAERTGCTFVKEAVSGTTLVDNGSTSYVQRMINNMSSQTDVDHFICQLSTNDAQNYQPLGSISDSMDMADFDRTTVIGAMEYIIAYAKDTWDCPVSFYTNVYTKSPLEWKAQYELMIDALYDLQEKWGIGIIDLWNNEDMRAVSTNQFWEYMGDDVHPNAEGYSEWWTPVFEEYFLDFYSNEDQNTEENVVVEEVITEVVEETIAVEEVTTEVVEEETTADEEATTEVVEEETTADEEATTEVVEEETTVDEEATTEVVEEETTVVEETATEVVVTEEAVEETTVAEEVITEVVEEETTAVEETATEVVVTEETVEETTVAEEVTTEVEEVATEVVVTEEAVEETTVAEEVTTEVVEEETTVVEEVVVEEPVQVQEAVAASVKVEEDTTPVRRHLILDGRMSMSSPEKSRGGSLRADNPCDILGAHYYEGNYAERCKNDTITAHAAGKPFILGEFGAKVEAQPCIDVFEQGRLNDTNGIMMWSLRAHKDGYGYYWHDEDGYWASYHWPGYPSGDYYGETEIIRAIYAYAQIANGVVDTYEEAKLIPIPAPEQDEAPLLYGAGEYHNSFLDGSVGDIKWRGVVGGAWYQIQRADGVVTEENAATAEWTTIADATDYIYDCGRNWEDKAHDCIAGYHDETAVDGQTYSYRLRACNESGEGLWSNIVTVNSAKHVVVDDLDLIAVSSDDANPTEIRNTYSSDHSANIKYSSSSIVNQSTTEGYIEYEATIPVSEVVVTAVSETEEGSEPKIFVSADGINYDAVEEVAHEAGTLIYSASNVSDAKDYYYTRIYLAGQSKCKLDAISITYTNDGESYRTELEGAGVKSNVMIQDNTFGIGKAPYYTMKSSNLAAATGAVKGITPSDDQAATILYKTADDINAYRIVVYEKGDVAPVIEYSYDGITYNTVEELVRVEEGDYTKVTYGDLNVSDTIRVVRVQFPAGTQDDIVLKSVEISSGTKSIPLAESSPANTLEDGEYYFGDNANLAAEYVISKDGNAVVYAKEFDSVDFSEYDCVYAWVKADNSGNTFNLKLTDASGEVWTSEDVVLTGTNSEMKKFFFGDMGEFDLASVTKFEFVITSANTVTEAAGEMSLNENNFYTGNYGVALTYDFDGTEKTVYVDSVYVSSSIKADDFEGYSGSNTLLRAAYARNTGGGTFDMSLDSVHKSQGAYGARIDYNYDGKGYAGAVKQMDLLNLAGYDGFMMYVESDGSGNQFKLQMETDLSTYNYTGYFFGEGPMIYYLPFADIVEADWTGGTSHLDETQNLKTVELYTNQEGSVTSGTFYVDDIKGANFVDDLASQTAVTSTYAGGAIVTDFPYTISGTAKYVDYVSLTIGEKTINMPVNEDGTWSYEINAESGIYNGNDMEVQAGYYYPNRDVIATAFETPKTITISVAGNEAPIVESYDKVVWDWDFGTNGTDGWTFEGFSPWTEAVGSPNFNEGDTALMSWSTSGIPNAVYSYTITGIPNGVYTFSNDIRVKNCNVAQMALTDGTTEVKSSTIDTGDAWVDDQFLGEKFEVTNNQVTVKYYADADADANGSIFAVNDIKLYFVEGLNLIENGDFSTTEPFNGSWPNYPTGWTVTPYSGDGHIKTQEAWFEAGNNKVQVVTAGTAFSLSQDVTVQAGDAGTYTLSTAIDMVHNPCTVDNFVMKVTDATGAVVSSMDLENGTCRLSDIALTEGTYTVTISGTLATDTTPDDGNGPVVFIDDVKLVLTDFEVPEEEPEVELSDNFVVNGDFASLGAEWPNLPTDWEASYTGGDGWSPIKGQDGQFVGYADNAYTFELAQTVANLPDGVYQLTADIVLLNEGYANAITIGVNDISKDVVAEVNATDFTNVKIDNIVIKDGVANIVFTGDFTGKGLKLDNVALQRYASVDYVVNGDFASLGAEWPNLPTDWEASYTGGDGWSPIKGQDEVFVGYADSAYTFELKQTAEVPNGVYQLTTDIVLLNEGYANAITVGVNDTVKDVVAEVNATDFTTITLEDIVVTDGVANIVFTGDFTGKGLKLDNVTLVWVGGVELTTNGDFASLGAEWPNLPTDWETSYTGGDGWSPIKGQDEVFVGYADNAYTFELKQEIANVPDGVYQLTADIVLLNEGYANAITVGVNDTSKDVVAEINATDYTTVILDKVEIVGGVATIVFTGDFTGKGVKIDNVSLKALYPYSSNGTSTPEIPEGMWVDVVEGYDYIYTGKAIKPAIVVYDGATELVLGKDYTVSYSNNTKVYTGDQTNKMPTIKVKGKGNYADTKVINFNIIPKSLSDDDVEIITEEYVEAGSKGYTPKVTVKYNGKKLTKGKDYEVVAYSVTDTDYANALTEKIKEPGEYLLYVKAVQIEGKDSNFCSQEELRFTIIDPADEEQPVLFSKAKVTVAKKKLYTGSAITLADDEIKVTYKGKTLVKDTDYTVEYDETTNVEIGTAKVILKGLGKYKGDKVVTFKIEGKAISKATAKVAAQTYYGGTFEDKLGDVVYTVAKGEETYFANYERADGKTDAIAKGVKVKLVEGQDYEVSTESVKAGKGVITLTGMNFFSGSKKVNFSIKKFNIKTNEGGAFVNDSSDIVIEYAKGGSKPSVVVTFNGVEMVEGVDYTLSYSNNKAVTTEATTKKPTIKINGKGNFTGTATKEFSILSQAIDAEGIVVTAKDVVYKKKANNFVVSGLKVVDIDGKALSAGKDFERVTNSADTLVTDYQKKVGDVWEPIAKGSTLDAGTEVRVVIDGKGAYTGTTYAYYRIIDKSQDISKLTVKIADQTYTGNAIEPTADQYTFKKSGKPVEGVTFEVVPGSYKNNVKKGTAKVTIIGTGEYGGMKTVSFKIKPESVTTIRDLLASIFGF